MSRTDFIYLDHAATSPLLPEVKEAMINAMDLPGNASSLHRLGHAAHNLIEETRTEVAKLIGAADPAEIIFTSGGSEANNIVIKTFADQPIAVSAIEHPSVLEPAKSMASKLTVLPVDRSGLVQVQQALLDRVSEVAGCNNSSGTAFRRLLPRMSGLAPVKAGGENRVGREELLQPALVSIMLANNELGTIQDIKNFAKLAHTKNSYFHTDATQALGKIPINVQQLGVDYLTASAHKIGGPVGVGILYIKKGSPIKPLIQGGHQEHGLRAGTYNTVGIAGLGVAAKYANEHKTWQTYAQKVKPLRNELARRILAEIPHSSINSPKNSLPNILNCSFAAAEGESIQLYLDLEGGIIVSTGSACASGDSKPSHVIMATHNDAEVAHSSIRFSLGLDTGHEDIDHVMQTLPNIIKKLQGISTIPVYSTKRAENNFSEQSAGCCRGLAARPREDGRRERGSEKFVLERSATKGEIS